jgi:ATP-dependent Zn protease
MASDETIKRRGKIIPLKNPLSVEIRKSIFMLIFTLLSIIVLVSIVYLLNSSQTNQKGNALKQQQLEKDALKEQSNQLVNTLIKAQSYNKIENSELVKNMIKPETPIYIEVIE